MKQLTIADRNARVTICSMEDVVQEAGYMRLFKKGIYSGWANVKAKTGGQMFAPQGVSINENLERASHTITMNYRADVMISSAAWIYQEFRKSAPRWYKILKVTEDVGCYFKFECRLVERSDDAAQPVAHAPAALPNGVEL